MDKSLNELTNKEYRSLPYESYSSLKYLLDSPKDFLYYKQKPFTGSDSTLLGEAIHHYLQRNRHLVTFNYIDKRKKEEYAAFEADFRRIAGDEGLILPKSMEEKIEQIMKNINEHEAIQRILSDPIEFEAPFLFDIDGIKVKGKCDILTPTYVGEIKTSSQAKSLEQFRYEAKSRHYDMQAALYTQGLNRQDHYFIVCETTAPFNVSVFKSSSFLIESGKEKLRLAIDRYKRHILANEPFNASANIEEI
jgi:hypothetical protein